MCIHIMKKSCLFLQHHQLLEEVVLLFCHESFSLPFDDMPTLVTIKCSKCTADLFHRPSFKKFTFRGSIGVNVSSDVLAVLLNSSLLLIQ